MFLCSHLYKKNQISVVATLRKSVFFFFFELKDIFRNKFSGLFNIFEFSRNLLSRFMVIATKINYAKTSALKVSEYLLSSLDASF